ncbi:hypothetical protein AEAC466_00860 [Asticcacaulis sp. AC466]|uniref:patatin-like phospholipase family protein n=1 Tax=Asticcacaulis sp. AC466 TaxID=1282362 RepID=UPI0003C3B6B5|nr:patatin-like phospholipase family protein [Asticcacaulis sp. AC466]ESQ85755.1 hypothetical protein AEAC466_00860 [Asticcacaulis sp. AC466]
MKRFVILLLALCLTGCLSTPREAFNTHEQRKAELPGFTDVRVSSEDENLTAKLERDLIANRQAHPTKQLSILALSGGGADGAFGAGVLVGWTKKGDRPDFQVVTGVSTGALIAPFAFLGPDYDPQLREAYTSGIATRSMKKRPLGALFTPGVYSSKTFSGLVNHFVDVKLVEDIAAKVDDKGGRLYVATTNLDTQSGVIWDLGAIASQGVAQGEDGKIRARDLIRQVLAASASVPAAFAPVMIRTEVNENGATSEINEMHVDGSVTMPFFVLPESLLNWKVPDALKTNGRIYVLVNGNINPHFAVTKYRALDVAARSFDTLTRAQARTTLVSIKGFAARNGLSVSVVSIPDSFTGGGLMAFDKDSMQTVFNLGYDLSVDGKGFVRP